MGKKDWMFELHQEKGEHTFIESDPDPFMAMRSTMASSNDENSSRDSTPRRVTMFEEYTSSSREPQVDRTMYGVKARPCSQQGDEHCIPIKNTFINFDQFCSCNERECWDRAPAAMFE